MPYHAVIKAGMEDKATYPTEYAVSADTKITDLNMKETNATYRQKAPLNRQDVTKACRSVAMPQPLKYEATASGRRRSHIRRAGQ